MRTAKTAVRLPELEKNGEGGLNAGKQSGSGETGLQQATSHSANARMPRGDTTARQVAEVPGATLDAQAHTGTGSMRPAVCFANVASPLIHVLCP